MSIPADSKFSEENIEKITKSLQTFKTLVIKEFSPDNDQLNRIETSLELLIDASNRVGIKDCLLMSVGIISSITRTLNLDIERSPLTDEPIY